MKVESGHARLVFHLTSHCSGVWFAGSLGIVANVLVILDATTGQSSATVQQPVILAQTREVYNIAALDCKFIIIIKLNVGIIIGVSKIRFWSSKWDG